MPPAAAGYGHLHHAAIGHAPEVPVAAEGAVSYFGCSVRSNGDSVTLCPLIGIGRQAIAPPMPLIAVAPVAPPANPIVGGHAAVAVRAGQANDAPADPPPARVRRRVRFVDDNQGVFISVGVTIHHAVVMCTYCLPQELETIAGGTRFYQNMAPRLARIGVHFLGQKSLRLLLVMKSGRRFAADHLVILPLGIVKCSVLFVYDSHVHLPTSFRIDCSCPRRYITLTTVAIRMPSIAFSWLCHM